MANEEYTKRLRNIRPEMLEEVMKSLTYSERSRQLLFIRLFNEQRVRDSVTITAIDLVKDPLFQDKPGGRHIEVEGIGCKRVVGELTDWIELSHWDSAVALIVNGKIEPVDTDAVIRIFREPELTIDDLT